MALTRAELEPQIQAAIAAIRRKYEKRAAAFAAVARAQIEEVTTAAAQRADEAILAIITDSDRALSEMETEITDIQLVCVHL